MSKPSGSSSAPAPQEWKFPNRLAYVVNHSLPWCSDGYAVRTHEVARALTALGHEVLVINRPGRPWDIEGFASDTPVDISQTIDGVRYLFLPMQADPAAALRTRLRQAEKVLLGAFEVFRPGAVMAVSNWENAEPALYAARRYGAPFFYEQRGFWEMSQAAQDPGFEGSAAHTQAREVELRIAQEARAVFTLNQAMRSELARRGVPEQKIHLVPNGVSPPGPADPAITRESVGCRAKHLLGYVGSMAAYEGAGDLPALLKAVRDRGVDADLLVVGSNAPKGLIDSSSADDVGAGITAGAARLGLEGHVHVTGRVAPAKVGAYYSLLDAVVMPRRRAPVTELVSPLKPYAAAAYGLPVFMPDMTPMDEVAIDVNGSLYPEGDLEALADMLCDTLENGGHPAVLCPLPARVFWRRRVQPMSRLLRAATEGVLSPSAAFAGAAPALAAVQAEADQPRFPVHSLPRVALRARIGTAPVAALGPCTHLPGDTPITRLSRVNILSELATRDVGRFVIDWAGLQGDPGEWAGLWSIDNMRLNRLIMDACAIALDRGWRIEVAGPIARSRAPLFRTVARVCTEVLPGGAPTSEEPAS